MIDINPVLQSEPYDFLRTNPALKDCIYLTISGSYGYGTNTPQSDIDLRGVLLEQPRYLLGLRSFEQYEDTATDTVIYGLRKFIALCTAANPNTLELLGTDAANLVWQTEAGQLLRHNAHLFLTQRVIHSFGNYAAAQLRRFCTALCHDSYTPQQQEAHLASTLAGQIQHFNRTYTPLGEDGLRIYQSDSGTLQMDIHLTGFPLRDFVGIYGEMHSTVKTYNKLNHRNRKKDAAHLNKHAMHLIRLLLTGADILRGKGICTHRHQEHQLLMDIRSGHYSSSEIQKLAEQYQALFQQAADHTSLPKEPDLDKIEQLMMALYRLRPNTEASSGTVR